MAAGPGFFSNEADIERTKLEALRNSLQITDRVLSERHQVKLTFHRDGYEHDLGSFYQNTNWAAGSKGNDIHINVDCVKHPQSADGIATILGLNYHELAHVMLTPPNRERIRNAYIRSGTRGNKRIHRLWNQSYNILEDHRIETLLGAKYPSMRKYFSYAVLSQIVEKTTPDQLKLRHLLTYGRHHLPKKVRVTFKGFFEKEYGAEAAAAFEGIIDEYRFIPYSWYTDELRGAQLVQDFSLLLDKYEILNPPSPSHSDRAESSSSEGGEADPQNRSVESRQRDQMASKAKEEEEEKEKEEEEQEQNSDDQSEEQNNGESPNDGSEEEDGTESSDEENEEGGESDDEFNGEDGDDEPDSGDPQSGDETDGGDFEPEGSGEDDDPEESDGDEDDDFDSGPDRENGGGDDEDDSRGKTESDELSGQGDADASGEDFDDNDGAGENEADESSVGTGGSGKGSADIIDEADIKSALEGIMADVLADETTLADVEKYRGVMASSEGLASTLATAPEKNEVNFNEVTPEMFTRAEQIAVQLRQIWSRMEAGWEYGVSDGHRLNMQNAMMAADPGDYESIYDDWSPGQQDNSGMEVVIIGDRSSSTADRYIPPNWGEMTVEERLRVPTLATVFSRNIWELMYALQEVDAKVTVLAFDHECYTLYSREERVDGNGWYALRPSGGTSPLMAINEARRILVQSEQPKKLFVAFTDGEWFENVDGSTAEAMGAMYDVVKVAALVGGYTADTFEYRSSFDIVQETAGDILPIMAAAATQILERSAEGR